MFINTRLAVQLARHPDSDSNVEAPTIIVQDAFTSGGAQRGRHAHRSIVNFASDLDYVRGIHSWRGGVQLDTTAGPRDQTTTTWAPTRSAASTAYDGGTSDRSTRGRIGDPTIEYRQRAGGRLLPGRHPRPAQGLTLSPGVRYSVQQRVSTTRRRSSRGSASRGRRSRAATTTLRASVGIFHGWLPAEPIEQTLRLNGEQQREIIILNPAYPDPGTVTARFLPTNKYLIGDFRLGQEHPVQRRHRSAFSARASGSTRSTTTSISSSSCRAATTSTRRSTACGPTRVSPTRST